MLSDRLAWWRLRGSTAEKAAHSVLTLLQQPCHNGRIHGCLADQRARHSDCEPWGTVGDRRYVTALRTLSAGSQIDAIG